MEVKQEACHQTGINRISLHLPQKISAEEAISGQAYFTFAIIRISSLLAENARFLIKGKQFLTIQELHVSAMEKLK